MSRAGTARAGGERPEPAGGPSVREAFVLVGDPVAHSISPPVYRAAFERWGANATYTARTTSERELESVVRRAAGTGGGNVTLPHKPRVAGWLERSTAAVAATGACNCFWLDSDGRLSGDNTDVAGFLAAVDALGVTLDGARVLLLGAGGAARAVLHAAVVGGASRIDVRNRTRDRAEALVAAIAPDRARALADEGRAGRSRAGGARRGSAPYDLVVNATSLGLGAEDPLPLDLGGLDARAVLDLAYAPGGTRWSRAASALGLPAADGLEMLVRQAALSLRRWFPDEEPPLDAMRVAARAALGREGCG